MTAQTPPPISPAVPWVTVIIVNYNGGRFVQPVLDSIANQTNKNYDLILLDNASTDGSLEGLKTDQLTNFKLITLDENTGFARGNNIAAKEARTEWVVLLNPDAEAFPNWLEEYKAATMAFPDTKMFAGPTINTSDKSLMDGAGDCYYFLGVPWRGGYMRPVSELPELGECFSACGASALIHKDTFLEMGGFDESFFCYCEDVDLGFRFHLEGHNCIFWPEARAYHFGSGTTSVASPFSVRHGTRNRLWVFVKNMPPLGFYLLLPLHILLTFALIGRAFMKGRGKPTLYGFIDGLKGIGPVLASRRKTQARRKIGTRGVFKVMSFSIAQMMTRRSDVKRLNKED